MGMNNTSFKCVRNSYLNYMLRLWLSNFLLLVVFEKSCSVSLFSYPALKNKRAIIIYTNRQQLKKDTHMKPREELWSFSYLKTH